MEKAYLLGIFSELLDKYAHFFFIKTISSESNSSFNFDGMRSAGRSLFVLPVRF